ncbi:histidine kinase [Halostella sp. JP-L12]|uniref:MEDS domain-containing protein n=1 Tax=Halostella TaxID=1843185 RepID=UPI000EF7FAC5|nr:MULTISPECIES: MEDS domain-containing protein [Halostella]NHN47216.1 histidine kinase [Halostella sp. JP-L12]
MSDHILDHADERTLHGLVSTGDSLSWSSGVHDPHGPTDAGEHLGLVYEDRAEQFAAVVPFVREGIERGERCLYIVDDNSPEDVIAALREGGVDVEQAIDSDQLLLYTAEESYLRGGEFDLDDARDFLRSAVEEGVAEYDGFRVTAEETWLVGDRDAQEAFAACEAHVNDLLDGEAATALCQYDRSELPPEVVDDVIETHPYLVYDGIVCPNVYYTPPEEYFGPDRPARENERKLETLVDRTAATTALETHERYHRELYEAIADPGTGFERKVERLLELGSERFGMEVGYFARTDDDRFEIVEAVGDHDRIAAGVADSITGTHCEELLASPGSVFVTDAAEAGWTDDSAYERFGLDAYFATTVHVGDEYGTLCFGSETPREVPYTDAERTFLELMGQWVEYELERRHREAALRESYQITSDPELGFEEKLAALFDLGCEQFGLELGAMATVDPDADRLEVEYVSGDHEHFEPGLELPLSETYCREAVDRGGVGSVNDPVEAGHGDIYVYDELDVAAYLGTYLEVEGGADRTFFFVSEQPRDEAFSEDERAFERLMGQWVKYELENRRRERFLRESYQITSDPDRSFDEKLERLLELGRDWFGLEMGGMNHLPSWDGPFRLEQGVGLGVDDDEILWSDPGDGRYCRRTVEAEDPVCVADVRGTDWVEDQIYQEFELASYFGTRITNGAAPYGTLWFGSTEPCDRDFSETERTFLELMGQWVSYELERKQREYFQRTLCEVMADPDRSFDEKLQDLFDLGCERLDLELGGLARIDPATDSFEVEAVSGDHDHLVPGAEVPLSETYCQLAVDDGGAADVTNPLDHGYGNSIAYEEFGVETYLGKRIELENDADRTFFSVSTEPRDRGFSDAERAFHELMGEWVKYELERKQRQRALEESNERLEQFAYAASHDLQEPLRMVTSYLRLLERRFGDALDEDGEEFLEFAVDGADRMRDMIDGLLEYSRVETQGDPFEPVDLDAVLDDVLTDLQIQIEESDADIAADELPRVEGDGNQLRQVLQNLLENALTYSGDAPPRVHVAADRRGQEWVISVRDEGIGIDPDDQSQIFDVFDRLHGRDEYEGTGIGLALCQRIVERHGGDIWVDSEPGEGATFSFTLPADRS